MAAGSKTGGRKKGTPNKATADIKAAARKIAPAMLRELERLAVKAASESARVTAIGMILDRAYGKAAQPLTGEDGEGPIDHSITVTFVKAKA